MISVRLVNSFAVSMCMPCQIHLFLPVCLRTFRHCSFYS